MTNIFFCSDHHFGHKNIIQFCNRPYNSTDEMDEDLIKKHNEIVSKNDTVYFLGDLSWTQSYDKYKELFTRLNGVKYFIIGNHDNKQHLIKCQKEGLLLDVRENKIINIGNDCIFLSHYPYREWQGFQKGYYHCYGHTHCTIDDYCKSTDIGVDAWEYAPVEFTELKQYIDDNCTDNVHPAYLW